MTAVRPAAARSHYTPEGCVVIARAILRKLRERLAE